ncbi:hypothetical protein [Trueperella sp. LYQ143]|uniref:hypothetical protein n=1 Tax=unclassified Trueperella TaxID=2630174 RepID=UPI0039839604
MKMSVRPATVRDALAIAQIQAETLYESISSGLGRRADPSIRAMFDVGSLANVWRESLERLPSKRHHILVALNGDMIEGFAALAPCDPLPDLEYLSSAAPAEAPSPADFAISPSEHTAHNLSSDADAPTEYAPAENPLEDQAPAEYPSAACNTVTPEEESQPSHVFPRPENTAEEEICAYELTNLCVPQRYAGRGHDARLLAAATDYAHDATELYTWIIAGYDAATSFFHAAGFAPRRMWRTAHVDGGDISEHLWWTTF